MEPAEYQAMDAVEGAMWWYRALHLRLVASLDDVPGTRVADLGCGTGGLLAALRVARPGAILLGLEWNEGAAARACMKSGCPVARGSVAALPFADSCLDAAVLADVLCHEAVKPAVALAEVFRVLRPGGRLVVNMPAYGWLTSAHDRRVGNARRQTATQAASMVAAAGFLNVRARYWNGFLLPLMAARRLVWRGRDAASDVAPFPPWLDAMFFRATEMERGLRMPFGGSVLVTARRP